MNTTASYGQGNHGAVGRPGPGPSTWFSKVYFPTKLAVVAPHSHRLVFAARRKIFSVRRDHSIVFTPTGMSLTDATKNTQFRVPDSDRTVSRRGRK